MSTMHYLKKVLSVDTLPFVLLSILGFLLPMFFYPAGQLSLDFGKYLLVTLFVVVAFAVYLTSVLKKGAIEIPRNTFFVIFTLLVLSYLISSIFGVSPSMSFFGYGFETTTFASMLIALMLLFVTALSFRSIKRISIAYAAFLLGAFLLGLFHFIRILFGFDSLDFGVFTNALANTIGKWNEVGIFFGASTILSLIAIHTLPLRPLVKSFFYVLFVLSMIMIVSINIPMLWYAVGIFALVFFLYVIFFDTSGHSRSLAIKSEDEGSESFRVLPGPHRKISILALIVLIFAVFFVLPLGNIVVSKLPTWLTPSNTEVRPSWSGTFNVAKNTIKTDPVFGTGPNTFSYSWQLHKPAVNITNFWNVDFGSGIGHIPTTLVTNGIVGFGLWILFVVAVLYFGIKGLFARVSDPFLKYLIQSSFFVSAFLLTFFVIYVPTSVLFFLTFFFLGLFISSLYAANVLSTFQLSFFKLPRISFVFVIVLVFVLIGSLGFGYIVFQKAISSAYFQNGIIILNAERNIPKAQAEIFKAIELSPNDLYYRSYADLHVIQITDIISSVSNTEQISEQVKSEFQRVLGVALEASKQAQLYNPSNFENWMSVFRVYEKINPLGTPQAYENALAAYDKAVQLSPQNPALPLARAQLEAAKGDIAKAKEFTLQALSMKENYADAIFFLSQIEVSEGNIQAAIRSVEKIALVSPNNPAVYFRLGLLEYETKDYASAAAAFERATSLVPVYANAEYFLGLSYYRLNRDAEAIRIFEKLVAANPDNADVKNVLENIKAGREPFVPQDSLPLEENI